jgi:hypothetical protein
MRISEASSVRTHSYYSGPKVTHTSRLPRLCGLKSSCQKVFTVTRCEQYSDRSNRDRLDFGSRIATSSGLNCDEMQVVRRRRWSRADENEFRCGPGPAWLSCSLPTAGPYQLSLASCGHVEIRRLIMASSRWGDGKLEKRPPPIILKNNRDYSGDRDVVPLSRIPRPSQSATRTFNISTVRSAEAYTQPARSGFPAECKPPVVAGRAVPDAMSFQQPFWPFGRHT